MMTAKFFANGRTFAAQDRGFKLGTYKGMQSASTFCVKPAPTHGIELPWSDGYPHAHRVISYVSETSMSQRYQFPRSELTLCVVLPPDVQRRLRLALALIEAVNSPVNCLIAQATAQAVCLGLKIGRFLTRSDVDGMEILVDNVASQRLAELACDAQP